MKIGMIDLGKMGANMSERLINAGHEVVGFELNVPAPVIGLPLTGRIESRNEVKFADKLLASMRKGFGGHTVLAEDEPSDD